jgi:NADH-quinone oxidoreductase subunit H
MILELWNGYIWPGVIILAQILLIVVPLLVAVAYLTYAERKVIGAIHLRKGPNVVGPFGLLQPLADGLKLMLKETILPVRANVGVFILAPIITFSLCRRSVFTAC